MKLHYQYLRKTILWQAVRSGSILSLFVYAIFRLLFYEFHFSWKGETIFFLKIFSASCLLMVILTGGIAWFYGFILKIKRYRKAASIEQ